MPNLLSSSIIVFCQSSFGVFLNLTESGRTFKSSLTKQYESTRTVLGEGDELSMLVFFKSGLNSFFLCGGLTNSLGSSIFNLLVEYYRLKNKGEKQ